MINVAALLESVPPMSQWTIDTIRLAVDQRLYSIQKMEAEIASALIGRQATVEHNNLRDQVHDGEIEAIAIDHNRGTLSIRLKGSLHFYMWRRVRLTPC